MYGERWRDFAPLSEPERADVMRAAIGYALGEDMIGLDRFRTKYAPKMAEGPDRRAFEVVTAPFNTNAPEFGDIARVVAATDTLEAFLRDIRARFPETTGPVPARPPRREPRRAAASRQRCAQRRRPRHSQRSNGADGVARHAHAALRPQRGGIAVGSPASSHD